MKVSIYLFRNDLRCIVVFRANHLTPVNVPLIRVQLKLFVILLHDVAYRQLRLLVKLNCETKVSYNES